MACAGWVFVASLRDEGDALDGCDGGVTDDAGGRVIAWRDFAVDALDAFIASARGVGVADFVLGGSVDAAGVLAPSIGGAATEGEVTTSLCAGVGSLAAGAVAGGRVVSKRRLVEIGGVTSGAAVFAGSTGGANDVGGMI